MTGMYSYGAAAASIIAILADTWHLRWTSWTKQSLSVALQLSLPTPHARFLQLISEILILYTTARDFPSNTYRKHLVGLLRLSIFHDENLISSQPIAPLSPAFT